MKYWNDAGKYQDLYEKLDALLPSVGAVANPTENRCLEKLRKAANCYYDLYNNGLCNRATEFRSVFGFSGTPIPKARFDYPVLQDRLDERMDEIILAAAKEQGLA